MRWFKLCLIKAYFEKGLSLMNYPTKALIVIGIGAAMQKFSLNYITTFSFFYGLLCFIIGYIWYKYGFIEAEIEVNNRFNLFVKEMRDNYK